MAKMPEVYRSPPDPLWQVQELVALLRLLLAKAEPRLEVPSLSQVEQAQHLPVEIST
jgi:hypothetical protein